MSERAFARVQLHLKISLLALGLFESSSNRRDRTVSSGNMRDIAVTLPLKMKEKVFEMIYL